MTEPPVALDQLEYRFGKRTAIAGIDLCMRRGEILGLVGPNGSGKTTLLKLLAGLLRPSAGSVRVFGLDPSRERARVMRLARFAFAPAPLFEELRADENLHHIARLGGTAPSEREIHALLDVVGLEQRSRDRVHSFSMGMKQRLALAMALLPRPELLVLDEPTDGLDPLAVLELRAVLATLRDDHGVTILLSSHLMIEVEKLVDRMLVLSEGRVEFLGAPAELLQGGERLLLSPESGEVGAFADHLRAEGFEAREFDANFVALPPGSMNLERARELSRSGGFGLRSFHHHRPQLEEALLERQRRRRQASESC